MKSYLTGDSWASLHSSISRLIQWAILLLARPKKVVTLGPDCPVDKPQLEFRDHQLVSTSCKSWAVQLLYFRAIRNGTTSKGPWPVPALTGQRESGASGLSQHELESRAKVGFQARPPVKNISSNSEGHYKGRENCAHAQLSLWGTA